jgi:hypothetical protein
MIEEKELTEEELKRAAIADEVMRASDEIQRAIDNRIATEIYTQRQQAAAQQVAIEKRAKELGIDLSKL